MLLRSCLPAVLALVALVPPAAAEADAAEPDWCEGPVDRDCAPGWNPDGWCGLYVNVDHTHTCLDEPGAPGAGCSGDVDVLCESGSRSCEVFVRTFCLSADQAVSALGSRIDAAVVVDLP